MLIESFVAIMALIAACALTPGVYFAINAPASAIGTTAASAAAAVQHWGFTLDPAEMTQLAQQVGEKSLLSRTGGAPSLAVGMAQLFSNALGGSGAMALWYHFAIMFEALFILTTLDAGTRVGRFMLQDLGKHRLGAARPRVVVSGGADLERDLRRDVGPLSLSGRHRSARRHQLALAAVRHLEPAARGGRAVRRHDRHHQDGHARVMRWVTLLPLAWLVDRDDDAPAGQKIFSPDPKLGFLSHARLLRAAAAAGRCRPAIKTASDAQRMAFNDYLDAAVAAFFMISVVVILADSLREWTAVLRGRKPATSYGGAVPAARRRGGRLR